MGDVLERRDRQVAVGRLGLLQDGHGVAWLDSPPAARIASSGARSMGSKGSKVRSGTGRPERRSGALLAPLGVLLGRAPVDVVAVARVHAAHVDALDGAGGGALEAGLALEGAGLVVEQDEPAAVPRRDVVDDLGILHRDLGSAAPGGRRTHALDDAQAGDAVRPHRLSSLTMMMAAAVTKMLSSAAGIIHFQAKPMSWSMRTRGNVAAHEHEEGHQGERLGQEPDDAHERTRS